MKKRLMLLVLALSAITITCPYYAQAKSESDASMIATGSMVKKIKIVVKKVSQTRTLLSLPQVYLNEAEYRLYVIHSQNGDMGTFRIEDPSGMIEHSDSYKADGSTNEFSLPPFLSGQYTIILECGGEEYEGEFVI